MYNSVRISHLRRFFAACAILVVTSLMMISAGAISIPTISAAASQTYFINNTANCSVSSTQAGSLQYGTVPTSSGSSAYSGRNSCYYLSSSSMPASITSDDTTFVLFLYPIVGTSQSIALTVCDETQSHCSTASTFVETVSGSSCASATQVTLDAGMAPYTFNSGDTLELLIADASIDGSSFVVCSGGSTASYMTLNPSETTTSTTTITSVSTSIVTSTVTSSFTTTSTSVSTETDTTTQTVLSTVTDTSTVSVTDTTTVTSVSTISQTVTSSAISLKCSPSQFKLGQKTQCTATAIAGNPPAGYIAFSAGPGAFGTPACTTSANTLICKVAYTPSARGFQTVSATYQGDPNYLTATASTQIKAGSNYVTTTATGSTTTVTGSATADVNTAILGATPAIGSLFSGIGNVLGSIGLAGAAMIPVMLSLAAGSAIRLLGQGKTNRSTKG